MKTMKGLSVNRMLGSIKRKAGNAGGSGQTDNAGGSSHSNLPNRNVRQALTSIAGSSDAAMGTTPAGTPEATAHNSVVCTQTNLDGFHLLAAFV